MFNKRIQEKSLSYCWYLTCKKVIFAAHEKSFRLSHSSIYHIISICLKTPAYSGKRALCVSAMHIQTEHVHTSRAHFLENDGEEYWDWIRRRVLNSLVWVGELRAEKERKLKHCLRWIMQFQGLSGKGATHFIAYIFRRVRKVACMSLEYFRSKFSKLFCHRSTLRPCGS